MEWNGRFQEWNGRQSSILSYQFHTKFCSFYLQKNTYRCRVLINSIVTEVFNFNIYAYYLSTNAVLWLCTLCKQCTYCIIASTLQFNCSIELQLTTLIDLTCFCFEADIFPSCKFCFLKSSRKLVFAISSPFQLNFIYYIFSI